MRPGPKETSDSRLDVYCRKPHQFFHQNRQSYLDFHGTYQLWAFSHNSRARLLDNVSHSQNIQLTDIPCLGIIPVWHYPVPEGTEPIYDSDGQLNQPGTVFCVSNTQDTGTFFQPKIISKITDLRRANEMINHCVKNHADCGLLRRQLVTLQLIDCRVESGSSSEIKKPVKAP